MGKFALQIFAFAASLLLVSCGGRGSSGSQAAVEARKFPPMPSVPSVMTDRNEAYEYIVSKYWDAFLEGSYTCDSTLVNGVPTGEVEKALGTYVTLVGRCSHPFGKKAVGDLFKKLEVYAEANPSSNVFPFFAKNMEKYLYDPNSPVRDEDLYQPFVSRLAVSDLVPEEMKPAYSHDAAMCALNQVGTKAADIVFTDLKGRRRNLHGIKADHTLLFFTNPGCPACREIIGSIEGNQAIARDIQAGKLAVVNIYIDQEIGKWKEHAKDYPATWYSGYDQDYVVRTDVTYNVRAIPSLYLLDGEKKVVLKDAPPEKVIDYLEFI